MPSVSEIKNLLNESTLDLGSLCKSRNINKWSFYKPVPVDTYSRVTDSEIYSVDCGFNLPDFVGNFDDILKMIELDRTEFGYFTNPPYRLGDFINYNKVAEPWFNLSSVVTGQTLEITLNQPQYLDTIKNFYTAQQFDASGYILYNPSITYYINERDVVSTTNILSNTYTIYPCLSNAGSEPHLYNQSTASQLRFLLLESNKNTVEIINTQPSVFDNVVVRVIWNSGGYVLGNCSFRGEIQITTDRTINLTIRNNNEETAESQMYNREVNNVTLTHDNLEFTDWTTSSDFARLTITLDCEGYTAEILVFVDETTELPISKTFVYNGGRYEETN